MIWSNEKRLRPWKVTFGVLLAAGLVIYICIMAEISAASKAIYQTRSAMKEVSASINNLELRMENYKKRTAIEDRARDLGMSSPTADQIRVISIPEAYRIPSTHTSETAQAD